jgi:dTDP-4-dehydrorhamnose reductase
MKNILVTGASGQLGSAIKAGQKDFKDLKFFFRSSQELDITNPAAIKGALGEQHYDLVVNTAAYTAVDQAETETERAYLVNALATKYLAEATAALAIPLLHISTDYVFDGLAPTARLESDATNPIGVYGKTKLEGELFALKANPKTIIIRTAWVYSEFGSNFVKTMLRLFSEKEQLNVIADQIGSPTNANDLAHTIGVIANSSELRYGIFNYSNEGQCSWFEFAKEIKILVQSPVVLSAITTDDYFTAAQRPAYSLLNKEKIKKNYNISIPHWKVSLRKLLT